MNYAVCPNEELRKLCIREDWFNAGTNSQYDKLFLLNRESVSISEIALAIWLCTDGADRGDIYDKLIDANESYGLALGEAQQAAGERAADEIYCAQFE